MAFHACRFEHAALILSHYAHALGAAVRTIDIVVVCRALAIDTNGVGVFAVKRLHRPLCPLLRGEIFFGNGLRLGARRIELAHRLLTSGAVDVERVLHNAVADGIAFAEFRRTLFFSRVYPLYRGVFGCAAAERPRHLAGQFFAVYGAVVHRRAFFLVRLFFHIGRFGLRDGAGARLAQLERKLTVDLRDDQKRDEPDQHETDQDLGRDIDLCREIEQDRSEHACRGVRTAETCRDISAPSLRRIAARREHVDHRNDRGERERIQKADASRDGGLFAQHQNNSVTNSDDDVRIENIAEYAQQKVGDDRAGAAERAQRDQSKNDACAQQSQAVCESGLFRRFGSLLPSVVLFAWIFLGFAHFLLLIIPASQSLLNYSTIGAFLQCFNIINLRAHARRPLTSDRYSVLSPKPRRGDDAAFSPYALCQTV